MDLNQPALPGSSPDETFPVLNQEQQARVAAQSSSLLTRNEPAGVFAVRDVRAGNVKRVASAVGEGSIAVSFVHQVLAE